MNKAVLSFWKGLCFRHNIGKIRKAVMNYLTDEGIKTEIQNGSIFITLDDCTYTIDFYLDDEYPRCDIEFNTEDEDYQKLELSHKTFIADKVNTDEYRHSIVKSFDNSLSAETHFYFTDKRMLLTLFYVYFMDLKSTVNDMIEIAVDQMQKEKNKKPIGFAISRNNEQQAEDTKFAASHN
jgi:hypothetical protein